MKIKEYYEQEHGKLGAMHNDLVFEPTDIVSYVDPKVSSISYFRF